MTCADRLTLICLNTLEKYSRGRRGAPAKGVGRIYPAREFKSLLLRQEKPLKRKHFKGFSLSKITSYPLRTPNRKLPNKKTNGCCLLKSTLQQSSFFVKRIRLFAVPGCPSVLFLHRLRKLCRLLYINCDRLFSLSQYIKYLCKSGRVENIKKIVRGQLLRCELFDDRHDLILVVFVFTKRLKLRNHTFGISAYLLGLVELECLVYSGNRVVNETNDLVGCLKLFIMMESYPAFFMLAIFFAIVPSLISVSVMIGLFAVTM